MKLPWEAVEPIVKQALKDDYNLTKEYLEEESSKCKGFIVDDVYEQVILLDALEKVLGYYGVKFD